MPAIKVRSWMMALLIWFSAHGWPTVWCTGLQDNHGCFVSYIWIISGTMTCLVMSECSIITAGLLVYMVPGSSKNGKAGLVQWHIHWKNVRTSTNSVPFTIWNWFSILMTKQVVVQCTRYYLKTSVHIRLINYLQHEVTHEIIHLNSVDTQDYEGFNFCLKISERCIRIALKLVSFNWFAILHVHMFDNTRKCQCPIDPQTI